MSLLEQLEATTTSRVLAWYDTSRITNKTTPVWVFQPHIFCNLKGRGGSLPLTTITETVAKESL